ncbi:MAG TPA: FAD-dependent monooxygenase [Thermoanaerobaculia bacterium]
MEVDVAILGAGPAGATLAALLARRGASVALVDRDTFPRDKLCGEFLSYDALPIARHLGVLAQIEHAPRIETCRVVGRKRTYAFALPHPARGVSRMLLDDLLVQTALANGAHDLTGWTASTLAPLRVQRNGEQRELAVKVIAGAWGRWGRFDTQLQRGFVRDRAHRNFGFKRHYSGPAPQHTIDLYAFANGYLGVNAIEGGLTNICGLVHESRLAGHRGRWDAFVETLRHEEPQLDALYARHPPAQDHFLSSEPVIFRARSAVEGGVFMVGDASGVIDPLTGNGMAMAMQSAVLAAPFLLRAIAGEDVANAYRQAHHALFAPRIRWSRAVAALLSRPRALDAALATVRSRAIGRLFLTRTRGEVGQVERLLERC